MKAIFTILVFCSLTAGATTILIDHTKTTAQAQTLMNTAVAGDIVAFERGYTWSGQLHINNGGTAGNPITYTAYGTGAKPILTSRETYAAAKTSGNWTLYSGNVWKMPFDFSQNVVFRLWLTKSGVTHEAKRAYLYTAVNSTDDYYCSTDYTDLYLYAPGGVNPATYYDNIEWTASVDATLDIQGVDYVTISNLDIRGGRNFSLMIYGGTDNYILEDCSFGLDMNRCAVGNSGKVTGGIFRRNTVDGGNRYEWQYDVEQYFQHGPADGLQLSTGVHNFVAYNNHFKDCGHSLVEITNGYLSGAAYDAAKNVLGQGMSAITIRDNLFTGDNVGYVRGIGCDNYTSRSTEVGQVTITRNWFKNCPIQSQINFDNAIVCYNIWSDNRKTPSLYATAFGPSGGLLIAGYSSTSPKNMQIFNNTFANLADQGIRFGWNTGYGTITGNKIYNNLFINCGKDAYNTENVGMAIVIENLVDPYAGGSNYEYANEFRNNMFWKTGATTSSLFIYDNRHVGSESMTVAQFASTGNGFHSDVVSGNSVANPTTFDDYSLMEGSPALTGGLTMPVTTALKPVSLWPDNIQTQTVVAGTWPIGAYGNLADVGSGGSGGTGGTGETGTFKVYSDKGRKVVVQGKLAGKRT